MNLNGSFQLVCMFFQRSEIFICAGSGRKLNARQISSYQDWPYFFPIEMDFLNWAGIRGQLVFGLTPSSIFASTFLRMLTVNKKSATYFSSKKNGFIWEQEGIEIQYMQPWQATCKSLKKRKVFYREEKKLGRAITKFPLSCFAIYAWELPLLAYRFLFIIFYTYIGR